MKRIIIVLLIVIVKLPLFAQIGASCNIAEPFCSGVTYAFPMGTNTTAEPGPNYGCLYSQPNPYWYYIRVTHPGDISIYMHSPTGNDIDFACWGPFPASPSPCTSQLTANCPPCPDNTSLPWPNLVYPAGNLVDCSYDPIHYETVHISNALAGQYYYMMISNFSNQPGNIFFNQINTYGTPGVDYGLADCLSPLCSITTVTANVTPCNGLNSYSLSGNIEFANSPQTGDLVIVHEPSGISQTIALPAVSPISYSFPSVPITGTNHRVNVYFSDSPYCSYTRNYTKPLSPLLNFTSLSPSCGQSDGKVMVTVGGGISPYYYEWSNGQITNTSAVTDTISNVPAGTYSVTVTGATGCGVSASFVLEDYNAESIFLTASQLVECHGTCTGELTAMVQYPGNAPYTYEWSNGQITTGSTALTNTIQSLCAGNYSVSITNVNNCKAITQIVLADPPAFSLSMQKQNTFCGQNNGVVKALPAGGVPPYSYAWSSGSQYAQQIIYNLQPGNYIVTVTDSRGCSRTDSAYVAPSVPITYSLAHTDNICHGHHDGTATINPLSGIPPFTYKWNTFPYQTTATAVNLSAGTYTVTLTAANGCFVIDTVTIADPPVTIEAQAMAVQHVSCFGLADGEATSTVTGVYPPFQYEWNTIPVQTTSNATGLTAGTYILTVTDSQACTDTAMVVITEPPYTQSSFSYIHNSGTVTFSNHSSPGTYEWDFGDGTTSTLTSPVHDYYVSGTYTVSLRVCTACDSASSSQQIQVVAVHLPQYVSDEFNVFPNPASETLIVQAGRNRLPGYSVILTDQLSRVVYKGIMTGDYTLIDVSSLSNGMYFLMVNEKVIKVTVDKP